MPIIRPKTIVVSLQRPAGVYVSTANVDFVKIDRFNGETVELNDSPWVSTVADLVVDRSTNSLLGLSFYCDVLPKDYTLAQEVAKRLDPQVVCLKDRFLLNGRELKRVLPGTSPTHMLEITWAPANRSESESAQLMNGQWWWFYSNKGRWPGTKPVVAFGIGDLDEILDAHGLTFAAPHGLRTLEDFPNLLVPLVYKRTEVLESNPSSSNNSEFRHRHNLLRRLGKRIGPFWERDRGPTLLSLRPGRK